MSVVDDSYGHPLKLEEEASAPLAGGIMQHGFQCGMLWGAALAAGAQAYHLYGPGPIAETGAVMASQKLVVSFRERTGNEINCIDITDFDMKGDIKALPILKFLVTGGTIGVGACFRLAASYAPATFDTIDAAYSENQTEQPSPPVSCAALLAQKMGSSDLHTTMAAGFAGGIGFSGGACGALGAAIWLTAMKNRKEGAGKIDYQSSEGYDVIDRFVEASDYEFECREIVGRTFENVSDHADFLREGGCKEILEALATR